MKNKGFAVVLLAALTVAGCTSTPKKKNHSSSVTADTSDTSETSNTSKTSVTSTTSLTSNTSALTVTSNTSAGPTGTSSTSTTRSTSTTSTTPPGPGVIDLGKQKISYIRDYIAANPITVESGKIGGVNYNVKVTFDGCVIERTNLVKTKTSFGCDVSKPGKVFFADETGYIAVASDPASNNGYLYEKVADYIGESDSKYTVTGYISIYLGHPEIEYESFTLNKSLDVTYTADTLKDANMEIANFWDNAKDVTYNCAGHGYGLMYKFSSVTCYYYESSGSRTDIYYFTDGEHLMKVITHNRITIVTGKVYDLIGLTSVQNYSAAIYGIAATEVTGTAAEINLAVAQTKKIDDLRKIKASQEDTKTRYPDYTVFWSGIYKTSGYMTSCTQDGKYYIGIRDTYYSGSAEIVGKLSAQTTYKMALIENDRFWNVTWEAVESYNPYAEYINVDEPVEIYYIPQQLEYQSGETAWKIFILPSTLPTI